MDVVKDYIEYENTGLCDLGDIFSKMVDGYISKGLIKRDSYVDIGQIYMACQEYAASTYATNETETIEQNEKEKVRRIFYVDVGDLPFHLAQEVIDRVKKERVDADDTINDLEKPIKPTMLVKVDRPSNPVDFEQYLEKVRLDFEKRNMGYNIIVHGSDISISVMPGIYY